MCKHLPLPAVISHSPPSNTMPGWHRPAPTRASLENRTRFSPFLLSYVQTRASVSQVSGRGGQEPWNRGEPPMSPRCATGQPTQSLGSRSGLRTTLQRSESRKPGRQGQASRKGAGQIKQLSVWLITARWLSHSLKPGMKFIKPNTVSKRPQETSQEGRGLHPQGQCYGGWSHLTHSRPRAATPGHPGHDLAQLPEAAETPSSFFRVPLALPLNGFKLL